MTEQAHAQSFVPVIVYREPIAAMRWLETAFGFDTSSLVTDSQGGLAYAAMSFRGSEFNVCGEWSDAIIGGVRMSSPQALNDAATQFIWVTLATGIDEHCARARAAGAKITQLPKDQFYGDRTYRALDPEGHVWCFRQTIRAVTVEEMAAESGLAFDFKLPQETDT